jgi:hypothetical protein
MSEGAMPEEGFLRRWARRKAAPEEERAQEEALVAPVPVLEQAVAAPAVAPATPAAAPAQPQERAAPTLDDVAQLTMESDYSAFVAKGVDKTVQRMALKKLFADPHFNVMDGLDIYISDYNIPSPMSPDMLAALRHAPNVLDRLFADEREAEEKRVAAQGVDIEPGADDAPVIEHDVPDDANDAAHDADKASPTEQGIA